MVSLTTVTIVAASRAEVDRRGAGEAGPGDRHQGAAAGGPAVGLMPVTVGRRYVNWSAGEVADVPIGVVTVTSTMPVPAGLTAVIVVALTTVISSPASCRSRPPVAPVKPVPVIVTKVPPAVGPPVGLKPVTAGP